MCVVSNTLQLLVITQWYFAIMFTSVHQLLAVRLLNQSTFVCCDCCHRVLQAHEFSLKWVLRAFKNWGDVSQ